MKPGTRSSRDIGRQAARRGLDAPRQHLEEIGVVADGIERAAQEEEQQQERRKRTMLWRVRGETVLEFGVGMWLFFFPFFSWPWTCPSPPGPPM